MVKLKPFELEKSEKRVVEYLLIHGVASRYEMSEKGKSYSGIFNAVKSLQEAKLIKFTNSKKAERNPNIEVKQYQLTLTGLVLTCALLLDWSNGTKLNKVIEAHQDDLPLVFGKWKHFVQEGKEQGAAERLHDAIDMHANRLLEMRDFRTAESEATKEWCRRWRASGESSFMDTEYQVTRYFLLRDYTIPPVLQIRHISQVKHENIKEEGKRLLKLSDEWRDVCLKDPEIRVFCESIRKRLVQNYRDYIKGLQKWRVEK
jgi:hypothetical protein